MEDKDKKMLFGIGIVFLFLASVGFSYAYFRASITNNEVKDQVVSTGTLSLRYVDGAEIVMQNIKPGDTITKTVYVANTGTLDAVYNLVWQELNNEITNDEMLIEGTCTRLNSTTEAEDGTCDGVTSTAISSNTIKEKNTIEPNIIHKYDLTITFKDTNDAQNYNQGKKFTGVLGIEEAKLTQFEKDSWATIATNVRNGNTSGYNIGDTKEVDLGNLGKHNVRIANTSTPSECSNTGFSQTACGFVLEFEDIITQYSMMTTDDNTDGWENSYLRGELNGSVYNFFSTDLKNVIIDTYVVSGYGQNASSNFTTTDKLYVISTTELYGDYDSTDNDTANNLTRQLDYYKDKGVNINNYLVAKKGAPYWFRTPASNYYAFLTCDPSGMIYSYDSAASLNGVSPLFRIG